MIYLEEYIFKQYFRRMETTPIRNYFQTIQFMNINSNAHHYIPITSDMFFFFTLHTGYISHGTNAPHYIPTTSDLFFFFFTKHTGQISHGQISTLHTHYIRYVLLLHITSRLYSHGINAPHYIPTISDMFFFFT